MQLKNVAKLSIVIGLIIKHADCRMTFTLFETEFEDAMDENALLGAQHIRQTLALSLAHY